MQFHLMEEIPSLLRDMTAAAEQAATANPKCGDLKVTLNIGKGHSSGTFMPPYRYSASSNAVFFQLPFCHTLVKLKIVLCAL